MDSRSFVKRVLVCSVSLLLVALLAGVPTWRLPASQNRTGSAPGGRTNLAFEEAAREFQVPAPLLKAICYMEGRLSNNGGHPSMDNGYGCMHLIQNSHGDLLHRAARELKVRPDQLKLDLATNLLGGAVLLRDEALRLSATHSLPPNLNSWYGAVAAYSHATTRATALMYADAVYRVLSQGFQARADNGETVTLPPQRVQPTALSARAVRGTDALPSGCTRDQNVDYPQAIDCLVPAQTYDCNQTPQKAPCNFEGASRPTDFAIDQIVIHDIEGTAQSSLTVFQNVKNISSVQYIVDSDGSIYQVVREKDIAYHAGNYWYNQHSIGIEHAGIDATGYRWYNASEYLASAKLVAYLLKKYHLPLTHEQIVSHGTIPSPSSNSRSNHVDPGPYWLWDYYLHLIHEQGVPYPDRSSSDNLVMLHPTTDRRPLGIHGQETGGNFAFFYLYNGPSTNAGRIPRQGNGQDITDVTGCVEPGVSYYYLDRVPDRAGSDFMMYKIWYGVADHATKAGRYAHARLAWLAVPRSAASHGLGQPVVLHAATKGQLPLIYGQPTSGSAYVIGDAPAGAIFASTYTVTEDKSNNAPTNPPPSNPGDQDTSGDPGDLGDLDNLNLIGADNVTRRLRPSDGGAGSLWYEINYNHRQAWVPASEVTFLPALPTQSPSGEGGHR